MPRIKDYVSLSADNLEDLDEEVRGALDDGFQPFGNQYTDGSDYIQVVVAKKHGGDDDD